MNKGKKEKEKICNHNPKDVKTTLKKIERKTMVFPAVDEYCCKICHEFFVFEK